VEQLFTQLRENGIKMLNLLKDESYRGDELMDALNERNKLFEIIYNTKFTNEYLDQIKKLIDQNTQIMSLIEQKKSTLLQNFINFQKNSKKIMNYLKQGG
jgi:fibrillarin-like rRNA methylase